MVFYDLYVVNTHYKLRQVYSAIKDLKTEKLLKWCCSACRLHSSVGKTSNHLPGHAGQRHLLLREPRNSILPTPAPRRRPSGGQCKEL